MKLEELRIYQLAMEMGEIIWAQVQKWDYFSKDTNNGIVKSDYTCHPEGSEATKDLRQKPYRDSFPPGTPIPIYREGTHTSFISKRPLRGNDSFYTFYETITN